MDSNEIFKIALIGTERKGAQPHLQEQLRLLGFSAPLGVEETLLHAGAIANLMAKAGFVPQPFVGERPAVAPEEHLKEIPEKAVALLASVMRDKIRSELMPEFLEVIKNARFRVPTAFVPKLLDLAVKEERWKEMVLSIVGERGVWLAGIHPIWKSLFDKPQPTDWEDGSPQERVAFLKQLRKTDPRHAPVLIASTWKTDSLDDRLAFVETLREHIAPSDELFLETLLDDKSKEMRRLGTSLLAAIPSAQLVKRMVERAAPHLKLGGNRLLGKKLVVTLPFVCTPEMVHDGINPKEQWAGCGLLSTTLGQMLAVIPPKTWCDLLDADAISLCQMAMKNEHGPALLQGWAKAAFFHKDADWVSALVELYFSSADKDIWKEISLRFLYAALPNDKYNALAFKGLKSVGKILSDDLPVVQLLLLEGRQWSKEVTLLLMEKIKSSISSDAYVYHWGLKSLLKRAAYAVPPGITAELRAGWPDDLKNWRSWQMEVEEFLRKVEYRAQFRECFS